MRRIASFSACMLLAGSLFSCQSKSTHSPEDEDPLSSSELLYSSGQNVSSIADPSSSIAGSVASSQNGGSSSVIPGISSSAQTLSSSSAVAIGTFGISILKLHNGSMFQNVVFAMQPDSSYAVKIVKELDLSHAVLSFQYSGAVQFNGNKLISDVTTVNLPDDFVITFDGKTVKYHIERYYTIPVVSIQTLNHATVASKDEYVACSLSVDGKNMYSDFSAVDAKIRLRGNSSKEFYDKKPYRIKLGAKVGLLGMKENKDWVLLANYRDPTNFMNAVVFDMARYMGLPFTNTNRFVEVNLNGKYVGMYQMTEQIEQGTSRVAVDEATGLLLNLDLDDGPDLSPNAGDNFFSSVYHLPVSLKNPKLPSQALLDSVKTDFAKIEQWIKDGNYSDLKTRLDVSSLIDFLLIQEISRNVELVSPRSMYMYRTADLVYHFGPVWDFDGGFAFDWASMTDGHNYFGSQSWLMGSTNPAKRPMDAYDVIPGFFVDMFAVPEFVAAYKARWSTLQSGMLADVFAKLDDYALHCESAMARNAQAWPIDKDYTQERSRMKAWLTARAANYISVVQGY